jgi:hypothetical protein
MSCFPNKYLPHITEFYIQMPLNEFNERLPHFQRIVLLSDRLEQAVVYR